MTQISQYLAYLPLVTEFVTSQEAFIQKHGVALGADQKIDAHLIGIKDIDAIRILEVEEMPLPQDQTIRALGESLGFFSGGTIGVSYRYGICIKKGHMTQRRLVAHELVHTMQYERIGGIEPFLLQYLRECLEVGYPNGALEREARSFERRFGEED